MQARTGYHQSQSETLVRKNNTDSIKPSIKSEESGWMPASFVDGQLVCCVEALCADVDLVSNCG